MLLNAAECCQMLLNAAVPFAIFLAIRWFRQRKKLL
jgi:hypothetical protein